tara:strand:+ start:19158 stop:19433 length:276 start_codon:yes stop_codon:yes gene_type:complete
MDILDEKSTLKDVIKMNNESELKDHIVQYVGGVKNPENEEVNLEMIVEVLSQEFPELILCVSEENWVRGYHQALVDVEAGEKIANEKLHQE